MKKKILATIPATINQATNTITSAIDLKELDLAVIRMPASWTTANLTFQGSFDNVTYANVYDETGNEVSVTAAASRDIALYDVLVDLRPYAYIKIRSGTSGSAVQQAEARSLTLGLTGE